MNTDTGDVRYLVLDPHYTGRDQVGDPPYPATVPTTLQISQALGPGCEWKKESFWKATDFYNLIMPQIPPNKI